MLDDEVEEGELVWSGRRSRPISLATKLGVFVMPGELISDEKSTEEVLALVVLICIPFWNFKICKHTKRDHFHHCFHHYLLFQGKKNEKVNKLKKLKCMEELTGLFKLSSSFVIDDNEVPSDESKLFLGASTPKINSKNLIIDNSHIRALVTQAVRSIDGCT